VASRQEQAPIRKRPDPAFGASLPTPPTRSEKYFPRASQPRQSKPPGAPRVSRARRHDRGFCDGSTNYRGFCTIRGWIAMAARKPRSADAHVTGAGGGGWGVTQKSRGGNGASCRRRRFRRTEPVTPLMRRNRIHATYRRSMRRIKPVSRIKRPSFTL
jgi:hypothetical protein